MNSKKVLAIIVSCVTFNTLGGCIVKDLISPKPTVVGRVLELRTAKPIQNVTIKTYKNNSCGWFCSTRELKDSTTTDSNGNFSFKASEPNLEVSIYKNGYFGYFPGDGQINQKVLAGKNDFKTILLRPISTLAVTYKNKVGGDDAEIRYEYFACGDRVNTAGGNYPIKKEFTFTWQVEGNCMIDIYVNVLRNGVNSTIKESVFAPQNEIVRKTIEF